MPSSTWVHTSSVCDVLWHYKKARSVLDIGIGFGRWGFISREMLDIFQGRYHPQTWKTKITGVEIFHEYLKNHHHYIYDDLMVANAIEFLHTDKSREDIIFAGDVLEHMDKAMGKEFLNLAHARAKKALILGVPLGNGYPQGKVLGNEHETHKAVWTEEDFRSDKRVKWDTPPRSLILKERVKGRPYGLILMPK